nr:MAG TPA: hypothetical protein [Bacteriophage sp.]
MGIDSSPWFPGLEVSFRQVQFLPWELATKAVALLENVR